MEFTTKARKLETEPWVCEIHVQGVSKRPRSLLPKPLVATTTQNYKPKNPNAKIHQKP